MWDKLSQACGTNSAKRLKEGAGLGVGFPCASVPGGLEEEAGLRGGVEAPGVRWAVDERQQGRGPEALPGLTGLACP